MLFRSEALVRVEGLNRVFGPVHAVRDLSFTIPRGGVVGFIGANGAGKTSTPKALAAMIRRSAGTVKLAGEDTTGLASHQLVRRGLALVPEGRGIFGQLTVLENLQMGAYHRSGGGAAKEIARDLDRVYALMPRLFEQIGRAHV